MRFDSSTGGGQFVRVVLHPEVTVSADSNLTLAQELHKKAHELCFIANSVNFPVECDPSVTTQEGIAQETATVGH